MSILIFTLIIGNEATRIYIDFDLSIPTTTAMINLKPSTTMREIKSIYANKLGLSYEKLIIKDINDKELSDDSTVKDDNISDWGVLSLVEKRY